MTTTPNLALTHIEEGQANKEVTANDAFDGLDEAMNDNVTISVDGNETVTSTQFTENYLLILEAAGGSPTVGAAFNLTVPDTKRAFAVKNDSGFTATVKNSTGDTVDVSDGEVHHLYSTGSGIVAASGGSTDLAGSGAPYDFGFYSPDTPSAGAILGRVPIPRAITIPADMSGSAGSIGTNPDATFDVDVKDDGTSIGTISISTGGSFTFTTTSNEAKSVASGSIITFVAPSDSPAEATIADFAATIKASLT